MNAKDALPDRVVDLYDQSLLPFLPEPDTTAPYAVISAPGLGRLMGFPWWQAITRHLAVTTVFDAGDAPALAASALRGGQKWVICDVTPPALDTVREIAQICGGSILTTRPLSLALGRPPYNAYRLQQLSQFLASER